MAPKIKKGNGQSAGRFTVPDNLSDAEIAQLWAQEAADRAAELDSGLAARIPADVARERALALLR